MSDPWAQEQSRQEDMEHWAEKNLPQCEDCGCFIYDFGYKVMGRWYCEECMRKEHYREVETNGE